MTTRVDVVVPGAEGGWIARALREAGYDVREADDVRGSSDADAVVLAGSLTDFDAALEVLETRVLVVSWEPVSPEQAHEWGAFAVLTRPVRVSRLLEAIARELPGTSSSILQRVTLPAPPATEEPEEEPPAIVREPTIHLDPPARVETVHLDAPPTTGVSVVSRTDGARDSQVVASTTASGTGTSRVLSEASAQFSPQLSQMLRDADRRIFPNDAPLDVRFPGGDESADELVPDALLAEVAIPIDLADADPLEAFTFVGTPDLVHAGVATTGSAAGAVEEHTPRTVPERVGSAASNTVTGSDLAREGMLPPAGAIRVLWQAHDTAEPVRLRFDVAGGPSVELVVAQGQVVEFAGPAHLEVTRALRHEGLLRREPTTEEEARDALEDDVRRGRLARYELERRLREARERLLARLLVAPELRFLSQPADSAPARRILSMPLMAFVCEQARRGVGVEDCLRWLTLDANAKLALDDMFERRAAEASLEPEIVRLFEDAADQAIGSLFAGVHASAGLAGVVLTLASADALRFDGEADDFDLQAERAREHILAAHSRAEEGTYFEVLGVGSDATSRDIEHAHQQRTRELASLDLSFLGLEDLDDVRREALIALDEAAALLANTRLRLAYADALTPAQT